MQSTPWLYLYLIFYKKAKKRKRKLKFTISWEKFSMLSLTFACNPYCPVMLGHLCWDTREVRKVKTSWDLKANIRELKQKIFNKIILIYFYFIGKLREVMLSRGPRRILPENQHKCSECWFSGKICRGTPR